MDRQPFEPRPLDVPSVKRAFDAAAPFRHVVIDDFFPENDALALHHAFPVFSKFEEAKARLFAGRVYGPPPLGQTSAFGNARLTLASKRFTRVLAEIAGIETLAMDETEEGAGAHVGLRGSSLPIHADHNTHPKAPWLYRRLNVLVYLNPNWTASWKANLLLYDATGTRKVAEIEPRFNRAVLMDVNDHAFHGYHPLIVPPGESRQMLATYFYSLEPSPRQSVEPHPTIPGNPVDIPARQRIAIRVRRKVLTMAKQLAPAPKWSGDHASGEKISLHN